MPRLQVAAKMFLILALDGELIDGLVLKCTPEEFDALTEIDGIAQAPYCAKRMWVRVSDLDALPAPELERCIRRSYDLVVAKLPKKIQAALSGLTPTNTTKRLPNSTKLLRRKVRKSALRQDSKR